MARQTDFASGSIFTARSATATIAADNATLSDANYPVAQAINCSAFDTIFVGCEITGGSSPTMTIGPLFRDADAADEKRWKKLLVGSPEGVTAASAASLTTGALAPDTTMAELKVFGHSSVFLQITAITNATNTTAWKILVMGGRLRK
jgi:hypothetical protein